MIPFLSFNYQDDLYRDEIIDAMINVVDSKWYIMGEQLAVFEKEYARLNDVEYSVGVGNGLDALIISLKALGIGGGDEVIVPSNTYIASWLAVSNVGAIPVPVEPDPLTYNINADLIEEKITSKTKAILPVHLYGQSCNMTKIMTIAKKNNLFVVEDNAQSHLAKWNDKLTGSFGDINATSFYPGKNLGAIGDGGGITTNNQQYFLESKIIRNYGSDQKYYNRVKGFNSRLDELQASILNIKMPYLNQLNKERRHIAEIYTDQLKDCIEIVTPYTAPEAEHVFHLYVLLCDRRDELQKHLSENGIGTMIHYPVPPHLQEAYIDLGFKKGHFPLAEDIANRCLSLPLYPGLTGENIFKVTNCIKKFYAK